MNGQTQTRFLGFAQGTAKLYKVVKTAPLSMYQSVRIFSYRKWFCGHLRRIPILLLSSCLNNRVMLSLIGLANRRFHFLKTIFVAYGGNEKYTKAYFYDWHRSILRWRPWPVGFFCQNGQWGLMTGISSIEKDFYGAMETDEGIRNLALLVHRTDQLKKILSAEQITFAGVLPGILAKTGVRTACPETDVTVLAVLQAERKVRELVGYPSDTPLILLGGRGHVGERLMAHLQDRKVYCVDRLGERRVNNESWPIELVRSQAILVNLTKMSVVQDYFLSFWPGLVVLNEAYPPPRGRELSDLLSIGVRVFHVVGVQARSIPPFPEDYKGGIPCCAAWNSPNANVLIKELS